MPILCDYIYIQSIYNTAFSTETWLGATTWNRAVSIIQGDLHSILFPFTSKYIIWVLFYMTLLCPQSSTIDYYNIIYLHHLDQKSPRARLQLTCCLRNTQMLFFAFVFPITALTLFLSSSYFSIIVVNVIYDTWLPAASCFMIIIIITFIPLFELQSDDNNNITL